MRIAEIQFERKISEVAMKAEQHERIQIAMDLHDEAGTLLTLMKINLLNAQNQLNQPNKLAEILSNASEILTKTSESIQTISSRITPSTLLKMGIHSSVEEFVKTINSSGKTQIIYLSNISGVRFRLEAELNMYRIIQESLNNILKYGKTDLINLEIMTSHSNVNIKFNYVGFGLNNPQVKNMLRQKKGTGLKSIQARVNNLNADIDYKINKDRNAEIRIKIPLNEINN